ncbi:MAG TPA: hypothetical protein VM735_10550, partial [Candidatus Kapabacteria bacterium]|nr:hypothetical protein [Candidatus Kapabacteria bacterium]
MNQISPKSRPKRADFHCFRVFSPLFTLFHIVTYCRQTASEPKAAKCRSEIFWTVLTSNESVKAH